VRRAVERRGAATAGGLPGRTADLCARGSKSSKATTTARAVGIDLATTISVVVVVEGSKPTIIASSEGARTTPWVVAFARNGEVLVE
jgi:hypothetical protein